MMVNSDGKEMTAWSVPVYVSRPFVLIAKADGLIAPTAEGTARKEYRVLRLVVVGWVCLGFYSILVAHRLKLWIAQVGVALAYTSHEVLTKKARSKRRLTVVMLSAEVHLRALPKPASDR
jgi:hypothetical protein